VNTKYCPSLIRRLLIVSLLVTSRGGAQTNPTVVTDEDTVLMIPLVLQISSAPSCIVQPGPTQYSIVSNPQHGVLGLNFSVDPPVASYLPATNFNGRDAFMWQISIGSNCSVTVQQEITVNAVNDAPTVQDISVLAAANMSAAVHLVGTDVDGDSLTFIVTSGPSHGTLAGTPPNLTYTPNANFVGADSVTYLVKDQAIGSNPAMVTITVQPGISITNERIMEGDSATTNAVFTVSISAAPKENLGVSFRTLDGSAKAGTDYLATSGTLSFLTRGPLQQTITVPVVGDRLFESNELFFVELLLRSGSAFFVNSMAIGTIFNDDPSVGTGELIPAASTLHIAEPLTFSLAWTHPEGWRKLDSVDLLILDDKGASLGVRWHESENAFSLFNPASERFVRTAEAGTPVRFETSAAILHVEQSTGGGPPGTTVTIQYSLSFKPHAAGRTYTVEVFATDDFGNEQGFDPVGTINVLPK
jgi:hypothetical protein